MYINLTLWHAMTPVEECLACSLPDKNIRGGGTSVIGMNI